MSQYELWLTDDSGRRLRLLDDLAFFSYTRALDAFGTINLGLPFGLVADLIPYFKPDWRVDVWRSPAYGIPMRREEAFMLRKPVVYTRQDGVQMVQYYGRNGVDLLKRRSVAQRTGTSYAKKTDQIDDLMKAYVREQMLYGSALDEDGVVDNGRAWPQNEFSVQGDAGLGPSVTRDFAGRTVYDICRDLVKTADQLHLDASSNRRIHFDVVPVDVSGVTTANNSPLGWDFRTYADLRGGDRTSALEFSLENENIEKPSFGEDHLDEVTAVWVRGNGSGETEIITPVEDSIRVASSRWNRVEAVVSASSETTTAAAQAAGQVELGKKRPEEVLNVTFLNSPGGAVAPRSLYGVDWDFGDLVKVNYARRQFEVEIALVYVSVDESGKEHITARSIVQ